MRCGAVLVARDGAIVTEIAVGSADLEGTVPITTETLFEIASLTKQFTAAAVMRLVQDGTLKLDDPISKHLPGVPESCSAITIEHLLRHTSGIPGTKSQGGGDDIESVLPEFLRGGPQHEPGTHWQYWNQGYAIVTEIIRRASGTEYSTFCKRSLFEPPGMRTARFTGDEAPEGATVAVGRSRMGPPRSALEHPYGSYGFQYRGMGGAVCSIRDLWAWDRALCGDTILDVTSRRTLFTPGLGDYALGWFVVHQEDGRVTQRHGGGVRGFVCEMRRYPDVNGVIVVLANDDRAPVQQMMPSLERALRGQPPTPEESMGPLAPEMAAAVAGSFHSERGRQLVVARDGALTTAMLHWSPPNGPITHARLLSDDAGNIALSDGADVHPITLERSADGEVDAIVILGDAYRRTSKSSE